MGFLEELKKESNKEQIESQDVRAGDEYRRQRFSESIQGTMHSLHTYLIGLVEHLNRVPPDALISYDVEGCKGLPGLPGLPGLRQGEFVVEVDNQEAIQSCVLHYSCERESLVDFFQPNKEAGERQQQYLWKHKLKFSTRKAADERWVFNLESFVPVEFEYQIDAEKLGVTLRVMNHEALGVVSYTYDPEDINPLYLDELAKYIMRKPSRFHALSGDVVPDDTLAKLRQQVAERKAERAQELGEEPEKPKEEPRKKSLFKSLFKK